MTANLDIVTGERRNVLVIANEALRFQPRGAAATLINRTPTPVTVDPAAPAPRGAAPAASAAADVVATLQRDLNLDDATMTRVRTALRDAQTSARTATGGGAAQPRVGGGGQAQQFAGGGARQGGGGAQAAPRGAAGGGGNAPGGGGPGGPAGGFGGPGGGGPGAAAGPPADAGSNPGVAITAALADDGNPTRPGPTQSFANDPATQLRLRTDEVLREILTADQFAQYQALQFARDTAPRTGTLWTREADGTIASRQVQLGLAGLNTTEVLGGLTEGAPIVLRVREATR
jgi:hypothetical protein